VRAPAGARETVTGMGEMTRRGFAQRAGVITTGIGLGSLLGAASADAATIGRDRPAVALGPGRPAGPGQQKIAAIAHAAMTKYHLKALIVRVTAGGDDTYTGALGESMTGVPATPAMQVRNGFVAYSYMATVLLELVDRKKISLSDKLSKYRPDLPGSRAVTVKMLANSTSGYADYVYQPAVADGTDANPFRQWTTEELIEVGTSARPTFPPGTNWAYSHTNYAILGTVLAKAGQAPLSELMRQYIFEPMGLAHTQGSDTPQIPGPVLHTFSSERRSALKVPAGTPFYEETTFWNPSWTAPQGAVQTTDITDLTTSIEAIGSGKLLSAKSHHAQVDPNLVGFGHPADGCTACAENTVAHNFGLGVILQGPWITGNKFYAGSGAQVGYLPARKLAIAVITTYQPGAFDGNGNVTDAGPAILADLAAALAPGQPIPS
jgi:CubicO group peptidase (beta-lactamase class C family)